MKYSKRAVCRTFRCVFATDPPYTSQNVFGLCYVAELADGAHVLLQGLNKKNFKSSVAELNQLIDLYGQDSRLFLLQCLVEETDFRGRQLCAMVSVGRLACAR